jgi:hypothetical protein
MNDKELAQIEEWLDGQKRYKLLDTERKGLRTLEAEGFLASSLACTVHGRE